MKRPNVLLIYTDQQRWDTIRAGGNDLMHTPNLDALAARGALFNHSYTNCPVCMPSRMSMLSGQYPGTLGIRTNGIEMPDDIECVHNVLKRYNYHTANIGKLHFRNHASQFREHEEPHPTYGFDTLILSDEPGCYDDAYIKWVERKDPSQVENCRCDTPPAWTGKPVKVHPRPTDTPYVFAGPEDMTHTAFVAEETCEYIGLHRNEPFFCIAGIYAPHAPINPPQRFVDMYNPADMPLPVRNEGENHNDRTDDEWRQIKAHYYALVSHIDDQVGRILDTLDECGLTDDTIVIFTSDHGENLGDHGRIAKGNFTDSSTRVPLVVSYPKAFGGGTIHEAMIEAVDLVPTILDWCGVQLPPIMQGRSFRPLLEGGPYEPRSSVLMEIGQAPDDGWKGVRTKDCLYVRQRRGREFFYDLREDPDQLTNLIDDPARQDKVNAARAEMIRRWFDSDSRYPLRTGHY